MAQLFEITTILEPKVIRRISGDNVFKIHIPGAWAKFFHLKKGQFAELELTNQGFFVKLFPEKEENLTDSVPSTKEEPSSRR